MTAGFNRGSSLAETFAKLDTMSSEVADEESSLAIAGSDVFVSLTGLLRAVCPSDSQTLQALLSEVRQLRRELRTTTIASQRAQILLYRLQGQEASVARALQRLDEARGKLARIQDEHKHVAADAKQTEDLANNTENPINQTKALENRLSELKSRLESLGSEEQQDESRAIAKPERMHSQTLRSSMRILNS